MLADHLFADHALPSRASVLVVDDSPSMQRYLKLLLEVDRYKVETVSSGEEALERITQGHVPDAVLLDLQLPGMDGLKTLRRLRKLRPTLKVIMCSGVDDPQKVRRAKLLGAFAYLVKPVQHLYLSAALEQCLGFISSAGMNDNFGGRLITLPTPAIQEN